MRWLVLVHRYLGIFIGILMAGWCLSGIVMMYVGYPELTREDRLRGLSPVDLKSCCSIPNDALADNDRISSFQLEMLGAHPILRLQVADGASRMIDLIEGKPVAGTTTQQAQQVARSYGSGTGVNPQSPLLDGTIDYDQWTVAGISHRERPLYRFATGDASGTELYVSVHSGGLVQQTTARQRFWNWVGAVPHWLYFADLRRNVRAWSQVVIWTSLAGCFLTLTGLYLGIQRFLSLPAGRWSPFRGLLLWHHVPGLVAGLFALTWVASGLISMNPWGFLDSSGAQGEGAQSEVLSGVQVKDSIRALTRTAAPPPNTVSVDSAPFHDYLFLVATTAAGVRTRLDATGATRPLTQDNVAERLRDLNVDRSSVTLDLIHSEDAYYFSHHRDTAQLPVYRAVLGDEQKTRYYIDPVTGATLARVDADSRWYRWLHEGLHRMDFTPALRTRPLWDVIMLILMSGVAMITCTGAVLGIRRLRPRSAVDLRAQHATRQN